MLLCIFTGIETQQRFLGQPRQAVMQRAGIALSTRCEPEGADSHENLTQTPLSRPKPKVWVKVALFSLCLRSQGAQLPTADCPGAEPTAV